MLRLCDFCAEYVADRRKPPSREHHTSGTWTVGKPGLVAMADSGTASTIRTGDVCLCRDRWSRAVSDRLDSTCAPPAGHNPLLTHCSDARTTSGLHALRQLHSQAGYFNYTAT